MQIHEVIDWEEAELMLEQHHSYDFGPMALRESREGGWFCYWRGVEVHFVLDPKSEPAAFPSLAEALLFARSPRNLERLEELRPTR